MRQLMIPGIFFVLVVAIWEIAAIAFDFNILILPAPSDIAKSLVTDFEQIIYHTSITMLEAVMGFTLGSIVAYLIAISFIYFPVVEKTIYPYAISFKAVPLIAIAPLLVLWLGNGYLSKIVMSALVAFFPVLVNAANGLKSVDSNNLELMRGLAASKWQTLIKLRIPASLGYTFSGLKIATTLSVVGAIIGEFTGSSEGIGFLINNASYYLQTPQMFASIFMISICSILFFLSVSFLEKKIVFWKE